MMLNIADAPKPQHFFILRPTMLVSSSNSTVLPPPVPPPAAPPAAPSPTVTAGPLLDWSSATGSDQTFVEDDDGSPLDHATAHVSPSPPAGSHTRVGSGWPSGPPPTGAYANVSSAVRLCYVAAAALNHGIGAGHVSEAAVLLPP